jgi:DNA-binding HxlR family transcriptional regulator
MNENTSVCFPGENACGRHFRVMYHLTAKGEALEPVIRALWIWSQTFE